MRHQEFDKVFSDRERNDSSFLRRWAGNKSIPVPVIELVPSHLFLRLPCHPDLPKFGPKPFEKRFDVTGIDRVVMDHRVGYKVITGGTV